MPGHQNRSNSDHHHHHLFSHRHSSPTNSNNHSSSTGTAGRHANSPGTTRTMTPTVNANGETTYPEALPSSYQERFEGPARGTVIIGPEFPDVSKYAKPDKNDKNARDISKYNVNAEEYFELVMPDGRSLQEFLNDQGEDSEDLFGSGPKEAVEEVKPDQTQEEKEKEQNKKLRKILREGGYVIFSDAYIKNHPTSSISILTNEYQLLSPPDERKVDPDLDERKQLTERIKKFILEAEEQHRPLFRLKTSDAVYGEASYERRTTSTLFEPEPAPEKK